MYLATAVLQKLCLRANGWAHVLNNRNFCAKGNYQMLDRAYFILPDGPLIGLMLVEHERAGNVSHQLLCRFGAVLRLSF